MTQSYSPGTEQTLTGNTTIGLIERIVENWLTSASERSLQIPFCQLLSAQGEKLLYIASHGQFEKGKDVVTELSSGQIRAYQMKGGDIKLAQWREIDKQINNLVELPVQLPSVKSKEWHEPFLVTNGRVEDAVLDYINTANIGWSRRKFPFPLGTIEKSNLVRQFTELHGTFLPKETRDFQALLSLILRDGRSPLDKPAFAAFIEGTLGLEADSLPNKRDGARAITSCLLLTSYILGTSVAVSNHWAQFEAWTMVSSYILCLASRYSLAKEYWRESYDLALLSARRALGDLVKECQGRTEYLEGHPLGDGYFYGARQTLLTGLVSAWALNQRRAGEHPSFPIEFYKRSIRQSFYWGESASPYLALTALDLEMNCHPSNSESLMFQILQIASLANERDKRGIPDIFTSVEDALTFQHRLKPFQPQSYAGFSYVIEPATEYLARRWRRQGLARRWRGLTRISLLTSVPNQGWEWFRWRAVDLSLASRQYPEPQSWQALCTQAEARDASGLPSLLQQEPEFLSYFVLVYPHRLNVHTMRGLELAFGAW
jgi:hypothetical protein